jgi:hypothetical protein
MKCILVFLLTVFFLTAGLANAQDSYIELGVEAWYADISADWIDGDALFVGPKISVNFLEKYWVKGSLLIGEEDYSVSTTDVTTFDIIIGRALGIVDLGIGYRYWNNDFSSGRSADESGPII